MAPGVPGILIKMAEIDPPNTLAEKTAIRNTMAAKGLIA
jgi:hypothetical protein